MRARILVYTAILVIVGVSYYVGWMIGTHR